jgi:hypothetical protein
MYRLRKTLQTSGINELIEIISLQSKGKTQAISGVNRENADGNELNPVRTSQSSGNTNSDFFNISHIFCNTNSLSHNIRNFFCNTNFKPGVIQPPEGMNEIGKTMSRDGKIVNEKIKSDSQDRATLNEML